MLPNNIFDMPLDVYAFKIYTIIRSACEKAVAERLLMFNPAVGCELPKKERKEMKVLPLDQLQTFFMAAKENGCYEMFYRTYLNPNATGCGAEDGRIPPAKLAIRATTRYSSELILRFKEVEL